MTLPRFLSSPGFSSILLLAGAMTAIVLPAGGQEAEKAPEQQKKEGYLFLIDGEQIPANITESRDSSTFINVTSSLLENVASFKMKHLDTLFLPGKKKDFPRNSQLFMTNGDQIRGSIQTATSDRLQIKTSWGDNISVRRNMVEGASLNPSDQVIFDGTQEASLWSIANNSGWVLNNDNIRIYPKTQQSGSISSKLATKDKLRVSFVYFAPNHSPVTLLLWSNKPDTSSPSNAYSLALYPGSIQLSKLTNGNHNALTAINLSSRNEGFFGGHQMMETNQCRIDIFCSKREGKFIFYMNGFWVGEWSEQETGADPSVGDELIAALEEKTITSEASANDEASKKEEKMGEGLTLSTYSQGTLYMDQFHVWEWNGASPGDELMDIPKSQKMPVKIPSAGKDSATQKQPLKKTQVHDTLLQLRNGDLLDAVVSKGDQANFSLKSKNYSVSVPLSRIMGITYFHKEENRQRKYPNDVRLHLSDMSILTIALKKCEGNFAYGYSEALGNIKVHLDEVQKIEFNLYDNNLKKVRTTRLLEKPRWPFAR